MRFNREVVANGIAYRYVVSLPGVWTILFLHGSVERGSDGVSQAKVGPGAEVESHPERWPAVMVMPQYRPDADWNTPAMESQIMAALDASMREFHGDPRRVYLTGFSMGGYGTWRSRLGIRNVLPLLCRFPAGSCGRLQLASWMKNRIQRSPRRSRAFRRGSFMAVRIATYSLRNRGRW